MFSSHKHLPRHFLSLVSGLDQRASTDFSTVKSGPIVQSAKKKRDDSTRLDSDQLRGCVKARSNVTPRGSRGRVTRRRGSCTVSSRGVMADVGFSALSSSRATRSAPPMRHGPSACAANLRCICSQAYGAHLHRNLLCATLATRIEFDSECDLPGRRGASVNRTGPDRKTRSAATSRRRDAHHASRRQSAPE